ncbi:MAG: hypothetical protein ACRD4F_07075, partial [Candidatus Angelobacter sp.]
MEPTQIVENSSSEQEMVEENDDGLRQSKDAHQPKTIDLWDRVLCIAVVAGLGLLIYESIRADWFGAFMLEAERYQWAGLIVRPAILWGVMGSILLAFRTVFWFLYQSAPPPAVADAPSLTVIIPAYNEG